MKKIYYVAMCAIMFTSCGEMNISTANFSNPKMCKELKKSECVEDISVFVSADETINGSVSLNNAPDDSKVTFSWFYVDSVRTMIGSFDTDLSKLNNLGSTYALHCTANRPEGGWPTGKYELEMKLHTDNSKPVIKKFTVE